MKEGKFTKEETEKLVKMYHEGESIEAICKALNRKRKSVLNKVYHMALKRKPRK